MAGDITDSQATFDKAIEMAGRAGTQSAWAGRAGPLTAIRGWESFRDRVIALLEEALALAGTDDSAIRALLLPAGDAKSISDPLTSALKFMDEAVAVARRVGDKETLAAACLMRLFGSITLGMQRRISDRREVVELAEESATRSCWRAAVLCRRVST